MMNLVENQQTPQSAEGEARVITLCGSTKFEAAFAEVNQRLTMDGCVVISLGMFSLPDLPEYDWTADCSDLKGRLGAVHFQKIRMADEVYIVDPGGYVGESTRREIAYAESLGKPVRYLSSRALGWNGRWPLRVSRTGRMADRSSPNDARIAAELRQRTARSTIPAISSTADWSDKPWAPQSDCQVVKVVVCATAARTSLRR